MLHTHVEQLNEEIRKLRSQMAENSDNSSKPPSGDGLRKKPRTVRLRKPGDKPDGGQPGHKGHCLEMSDAPDHIIVHTVSTCGNCQMPLKHAPVTGYDRRQVSDIPPIHTEVTGHQVETMRCPKCGHHNKARFPAEVSRSVQYGFRVKSQTVYSDNCHHIPLKRTSEISGHLYGQRISEAVIAEADGICADKIAPVADHVREQLIKSDAVSFDETGIGVGKKISWLTVASTPGLTCYHIHLKRGEQGPDDAGILPRFHGIGIRDHRKAYFRYPCGHGLCNAHHLRELKFVHERYDQEWAENLSDLPTEIYHEVRNVRPYQSRLPPETIGESGSRYDRIIDQGMSVNPPSEKKEGRREERSSPSLGTCPDVSERISLKLSDSCMISGFRPITIRQNGISGW